MYFKNKCEFIDALYYTYYSTYNEKLKQEILKNIYKDYLSFGIVNYDFEQIYKELTTNKWTNIIDNNFITKNNGKLLSIKQLLHKKIKIHYLASENFVTKIVLLENNFCKKCGNNNIKKFFKYSNDFKQDCYYCKKCFDFGISNNTHYTFHINKTEKINYKKLKLPNIKLSSQQKLASTNLIKNINAKKNTLVWAVCGAGKTEIIYELIYNNLKDNKKICLAIPRKDVVIELAERIKKDFMIPINILYGNKKQITNSLFYIMTTHQLVYYYNFFDILIVDEIDAFPYYADDVLEYATFKAKKPNSPLIFLSATPSKKIKNFVNDILKIPIRYHQKLLPVPKISITKKINYDLDLKNIVNFIKKVKTNNRKALIFVPTIKIGKLLHKKLQKEIPKIAFVSSVDCEREKKINAMKNNQIDILITTTILERGITFEYLDVFVYKANHKHFTKEALIQIAGRVGRKSNDFDGEIIFYANEKNSNITKAIKEINYMNELAKYRKLVK